ncbi:hypothetical protein ACIP96_06410 [Streptomyces nigra]|uniref:hypothetical protein n=1 Tax=Streptomyces nigra TaxID=1827580 RepID=UPI0037FEF000
MTAPTTWATPHALHVAQQIQSRLGPADEEGQRWMEHRRTGLVNASCNCGYSTGWIPREQLPATDELYRQHSDSSDQARTNQAGSRA